MTRMKNKNPAHRAKLLEVRDILKNMALTFKQAERTGYGGEVFMSLPEYQAQGVTEVCRDMARMIESVLEGM